MQEKNFPLRLFSSDWVHYRIPMYLCNCKESCSICVLLSWTTDTPTQQLTHSCTQKSTHQRVCSLASLLSIMGSSEILLSASTTTSKLQHVKKIFYTKVAQELGTCLLLLFCCWADGSSIHSIKPAVTFHSGKHVYKRYKIGHPRL